MSNIILKIHSSQQEGGQLGGGCYNQRVRITEYRMKHRANSSGRSTNLAMAEFELAGGFLSPTHLPCTQVHVPAFFKSSTSIRKLMYQVVEEVRDFEVEIFNMWDIPSIIFIQKTSHSVKTSCLSGKSQHVCLLLKSRSF